MEDVLSRQAELDLAEIGDAIAAEVSVCAVPSISAATSRTSALAYAPASADPNWTRLINPWQSCFVFPDELKHLTGTPHLSRDNWTW
jgi:hypothetical protein